MPKRHRGWYTTTPRFTGVSLPPLPKHSGKRFLINVQPGLPAQWPISHLNYIGMTATCAFVRRELTPPHRTICDVDILLPDGSELRWSFFESDLTLIPEE